MKKYGTSFLMIALAAVLGFSVTSVSAQNTASGQTMASKKKFSGDIVETAVAAGNFTVLAKALTAAGLVDTLKGKGKFTVFAPTDDAFAKLPAGTLDELLKPENKEKLKGILLYHVVSGKVSAKDAAKLNGKTVKSLQGGTLRVDTTSGVKINDATVVMADVQAKNGVIHAIDTVLMPGM